MALGDEEVGSFGNVERRRKGSIGSAWAGSSADVVAEGRAQLLLRSILGLLLSLRRLILSMNGRLLL